MNRNDILIIKKMLEIEKNRTKKLNELLKDKNVIEYLNIKGITEEIKDICDDWYFIKNILKEYKIKETNNIYVLIGTYITDSYINYQETDYYEKEVPFDSEDAEYRLYKNIENGLIRKAYLSEEFFGYPKILVNEFEQNNIILNPYNSNKNNEIYEQIKKDFFTEIINQGQVKAKKILIKKYSNK